MADQKRPERPPKGQKPSLKVLGAELEAPAHSVPADPPKDAAPADDPPPEDQAPDDTPSDEKTSRKGKWDRLEPGEIFPDCPVRALGVNGETYFYLDYLGQLAAVTNHTKDRMRGIFGGRSDMLMDWFPQYNKSGGLSGWSQEGAATNMVRACTEKKVWNAFEKVRGLGAWPDSDGGVILHCGDQVLHRGVWTIPGEIDGYVYPSYNPIPKPLQEFIDAGDGSPGSELLELLATWNWLRGDVDAYLLLGWICSAMFGGALKWRPMVWMTGDAGTGKSTLQALIRAVMGGEGALLQSTDATEAAIRQFMISSTIPVALDEIEAEADPRKALAVVKLARQAASGGVVIRGGADHKGQEFKARSSFIFSSILVPALLDQDISRIALLEMAPLKRGTPPPAIEPRHWSKVGRALRTRILDGWERLHATLELYRAALAREGHSARGCDQFGTLLALADLALHDNVPDAARCDDWARKLNAAVIEDQVEQMTDWQRMLNHLFSQTIDVFRSGERKSLGRWVEIAANIHADDDDPKLAARALSMYGMRIYGRQDDAQLAIANNHSALATLFRDTRWHGTWAQNVKRVPGATSAGNLTFHLARSRALKFPLASLGDHFGDDGVAAQQPPSPPQFNDFA